MRGAARPSSAGRVVDRAELRIRAQSLDAQVLRLARQYEDLLTDLRHDVSAGLHLDRDSSDEGVGFQPVHAAGLIRP